MAQDTSDGQDEKDTHTEPRDEYDGIIDRRDYLKLAGVASLAGGSLFASGGADAAEQRHGITFDRTLDAVADLGMDDSGDRAIDGELSSAAGDGTLVLFPPGTYRVNEQLTLKDVSNFGIVGSSGTRSDVEFVTNSGNALQWLVAVGGRNHLYENFVMQQTSDQETSFSNVFKLSTGLHVENVELAGFNPRDDITDTKNAMRPHITSRDGVGVIKDFVCTGGGVIDEYPNRRVPIWMGPAHRGELRLVNAHIEESGSHSIYASRTNGCIRVEGGLFKNNDNTNLRLSSGHPDKLSWVKGAEVVIDTANAEHLPDGEHYQNVRGIKVESGFQGWSGLLIEDCDLVMKSAPASQGLIKVEDNHGAVTVRNTRLHNAITGTPCINVEKPNYSDVDSPYDVTLENVSITGPAASSDCAVTIRGRNGSSVQNACIHRDGGDGVRIADSDNCTVADSNINVPGQATIFRNSTVDTSGLTYGDSCPAPSLDGGGTGNGDTDSGDSTPTPEPTYDHTLTIDGTDADRSDYAFTVSGDLAENPDVGSLGTGDSIDGSSATGFVHGGVDGYRYNGDVTDFSIDGNAAVLVDGTAVDPATLGDAQDYPNTLRLEGTGTRADYQFTVSEALREHGDTLGVGDAIDGTSASGFVHGGTDAYDFAGEITDFSIDGDARILLNGSEVDSADLGDAPQLPRTLVIDGGDSGLTEYRVTVSEAIANDPDVGTFDSGDAVDGTTASGAVTGGVDGYRFAGEIVDLEFDGGATLLVDGESVDPATLALPNRIVFDGEGADTETSYEFTVSGRLADDAQRGTLEAEDTIDGASAAGTVADGADGYRFSGDLTKLLVVGYADVTFEDNDG